VSTPELSPDNASRLAIFDALAGAPRGQRGDGLTAAELLERIIGRLRVLVPQELHVMGEQEYVNAKIGACLSSGILQRSPNDTDRYVLGHQEPEVRYPDGSVRTYLPGLESARERLEADESRLRKAGFNVRHIIKPASARRKSESFRQLVASMHEHGFMDQFPLTVSATAGVIDGLARQAAAAEAGVELKKHHRHELPKRRDTLLHHAILVLDANAERLTEEEIDDVHMAIADQTRRPWIDIDSDLDLTREWRRTEPRKYVAVFEVDLVPFKPDGEAVVQVTTDQTRVMLRPLMEEAGVAVYNHKDLAPFVAFEEARTRHSGRRANFVRIADAIVGIGKMQRDRRRKNLKVDAGWDQIQTWLADSFPQQDPLADDRTTPDVDDWPGTSAAP
jgi:hypothetical protein